MNTESPLTGSEIAVVGMSGRFPGASNLEQFWRNLREGVESVHRFTDEELARAGESPDLISDPDYVRARPVLSNPDMFDAEFFGFSPQDAAIMDPQHRIFLEVGWEALESAGYDAARYTGQVGVFATCGMNSYMMHHLVHDQRIMRSVGEWLVRHTGNDMSFLATGLSYHLNLKGPSLNVQCACSSALVAIHLASQSLLSGECDMALAGGSVVVLPQDRGYLYQAGEIMARDGHCRAFDAGATGTLFGSGAGVVVLRRLADALADNDQVLAVIKGSAINNDGSMKVGFLAPSVEGQSRVVTEALAVSGVEADSISYIEAHGTATIVGDPIEVTALTDAYRRHTDRTGFCRIGSLKSNIGHLGEAAGVAAFIKTVLSLQHETLPASINYEQPNPQIDFAASPFVVNHARHDWPRGGEPRRAGVTALGAGGTNCHVIVEEAPVAAPLPVGRPEQALVLSAKTPTALAAMRANLAAAFRSATPPDLADAAYTLQNGRAELAYRWSGVAATADAAVRLLEAGGATGQLRPGIAKAPVVFLFPGGGAQYPNMGRGLYDREPVFRQEVDRCLGLLRTRHAIDLAPILFPSRETQDDAAAALSRSTNSILSVFIVEYALSRLWMSWGVMPAAMSGHSLGEYVAACVAGVFTVEDALAIVKARGDVFDRLPEGGMLSVLLPEADIAARLTGRLSLAAVNAASSCVVAGPTEEVAALDERLKADGIETQRLHINVAAHSPMLEPFLDEFRQRVASVRLSPPQLPFVSNLSGRWITAAEATDPGYWVKHLRHTVRFNDGLATLLANPDQILLEVGPGRALTSLARQQSSKPLGLVTSLRHPSEDLDDVMTMMTALGKMWTLGAQPDWAGLQGDLPRRRIALPTYPFEHKRYWIEAGKPGVAPVAQATPIPVASASVSGGTTEKQSDVADWFQAPVWMPVTSPGISTVERTDAHVLVLADPGGIVSDAVSVLRQDTQGRTWVVEPGTQFAQAGPERFTMNPSNADDYVALFNAIGDAALEITHIVHGWTLPGTSTTKSSSIDAELEHAFFGPLALAQAIGRHELDQPLSLSFITTETAQIAGETDITPARATLLGPSRVLPRELPNVSTHVIDVAMPRTPRERVRVARNVAHELRDGLPDTRVAFRGDTRWVERFERRRVTEAATPSLRDQGVYIITGGMGGLGLELATHLASTVKARLVLVGRTKMPKRDGWDGWLAEHGPNDATSRRIRRVLACEALGARVEIATADVADVRQVAAVRKQTLAAFGAIHGIFHTAGTLDDGLMMTKTRESAIGVLAPKVHGTAAIQSVFAEDTLDFVALFSSISSIVGLQGQVDYTAANAFMDAVADQSSTSGTRYVAINWGPWKDVGLAVIAAKERQRGGPAAGYPWLDDIRQGQGGAAIVGLRLARDRQWMIGEHVVRGADAVLPGTGYLELARAALTEVQHGHTVEISDVLFQSPIVVGPAEVKPIELSLTPSEAGFECAWQSATELFATCRIRWSDATPASPIDIPGIRSRLNSRVETPRGFLDQPFMAFGPRWANIQQVNYGRSEALMSLALPVEFRDDTEWCLLHPALLDMATGGAQALIPGFDQASHFYVPVSYGRVRLFRGLPPVLYSHVRLAAGTKHDVAVFDVTIADESGAIVADVEGFCMKRVASGTALAHSVSTPAQAASESASESRTPAAAIASDLLRNGMHVHEGLDALTRVIGTGAARMVVLPGDLGAWQARVDAAFRPTPTARRTRSARRGASGDPNANVEQELAALWADLLGVTDVSETDDFFELGGHSLIAVRLVNRVEKRFGKKLKLASLFEARTIRDLAELIRGEKQQSAFISLVAVQPKGSLPPLYVAHGVGGEVLSYSALAKLLGPDQPLFAFRSVGHDGSRPLLKTIEEQATFYVSELRVHQPEGPYYLAGYSHGGRVAFEMAQQLRRVGQEVAFLGIIDMWPGEGVPRSVRYPLDWMINLPRWFWADVRIEGWRGNLNRLARIAQLAARKFTGGSGGTRSIDDAMNVSQLPEHIRLTFETNFHAFLNYRPSRYPGNVTLFRGHAQPLRSPQSRDLGWSHYVPHVRVVDTPGNHGSLLSSPFVDVLAERITTELTLARRAEEPARQQTLQTRQAGVRVPSTERSA